METIELGAPSVADTADGRAGAVAPPSKVETSVPPPNAEPATSDLPLVAPISGLRAFDDGLTPPDSVVGCTKVDFLFVIDNSFSMVLAQDNLKNSFGGFMQVIGENLDANDFHIMVVDTDSSAADDDPPAENADLCGDVLGAGRRSAGDGRECALPGTQRFISLDQPALDQPALEQTFSCMASVGNFGDSDEKTIDALLAAATVENVAGGCNEGFLRDDAILVVTIITNSDDRTSIGDPEDWYAELSALKGGDARALVVLGFVAGRDLPGEVSGSCDLLGVLNFNNSSRLEQFVGGFDHHQLASVCADDYAPFFSTAVAAIDTACTEFVPR